MSRSWTHSLFDWFSPMDTCCFSLWCPCIYGKTQERKTGKKQTWLCIKRGSCCCILTCCHLQPFLQCFTRGSMRDDYGIDGNRCTDCLGSWCCPCCVLAQEYKEVKERERLQENEHGYTSPPEMKYAP